ncbi:integrin alpha-3-like [Haliotis rufescens]|uniref:integrin alpha-3-like n=1 Tax=Haliotis rufescens TaxID=6454 RepID=UPI00201FA117|nr:integrin alpha-3-like [Haliotis rufescens]
MATVGLAALPVTFCVFMVDVCFSYNIDVVHARVLHGPSRSMFGYASAFKRTQSGYKLIVGAPKDSSTTRNSTGATHECDVTESLSCVKSLKRVNEDLVSPSGTWYIDNEMYGSVIVQTNDTTTVCAPRFNDLIHETDGRAFLIGRCVSDNLNMRTEEFYPLNRKDYFKRVSLGNGISKHILWNGMGQSGMSGDAMADGSVLIGVPGFNEWKGGVVLLKKENNLVNRLEFEMPFRIPEYSYLGYSVVTGMLCGQRDTCFAAGAPRAEIVHIVIFINSNNLLSLVQSLTGEQIGAYFGASLCTADVNGDDFDDLLVGAPFFTDNNDGSDHNKKIYMDEGRVFVYLNLVNDNRQRVLTLSSVVLKGGNEHGARFGTSIINLGDINGDGYTDVAVGAPYEDGGHGAIYIYHGGEGGLNAEEKQRIGGRDINDTETVTSFGWSISKPADVDGNGYPDIAVGAYLSDSAVILRTRPIVDLHANVTTDPQLIIKDKSNCPAGTDADRCFLLRICFHYTGVSLPPSLRFAYELSVDTYKGNGQKRVLLNSTQGYIDSITDVITADDQTGACREFQAISVNDRADKDPFTVVRMEASYQLPQPADPNSDIQPVTNQSQPDKVIKDVAFQLACGEDNQCWSDLVLDLFARINNEDGVVIRPDLTKAIVINATKGLVLDVAIRNDMETAFATVVYVTWSGSVSMQTTESSPEQPVVCDGDPEEIGIIQYRLKCDVLLPVYSKAKFAFAVFFTADGMRTDMSTVEFNVSVETGSNETDPDNNKASLTTRVWIDAQTGINGKSDPDQVLIRMDKLDKTMVTIGHKYVIKNAGPSFLPHTRVSVSLPYFTPQKEELVEAADVRLIQEDGTSVVCQLYHKSVGIGQNTTTSPPTTTSTSTEPGEITTDFLPVLPPSKLRERHLAQTRNIGKNIVHMDCADFKCVEYRCPLHHLSPGESAIVNITVWIQGRKLPFHDRVDLLRYYTEATVIQPGHPLLYPWGHAVQTKIMTPIYPDNPPGKVNIWVIIGSVLAAIIILFIIFIVLWKCGFFKREKKGQVQKWKRESGYYGRNQSRAPRNSKAPRESTIEE